MTMTVWVDDWQMQCCGTPFSVGDEVSWSIRDDSDADWLASVLGPETAADVDGAEEHHGGLPDHAPTTTGRVRAISAVHCRYQPEAGENGLRPVPGSAILTPVTSADGWTAKRGGHQFVGYLVRLAVPEAPSPR